MAKSRMIQTLEAFGVAMAEAERHRKTLRQNFGLTDQQIGMMVLARRPKKAVNDYTAAVLAAKQRLAAKRKSVSDLTT